MKIYRRNDTLRAFILYSSSLYFFPSFYIFLLHPPLPTFLHTLYHLTHTHTHINFITFLLTFAKMFPTKQLNNLPPPYQFFAYMTWLLASNQISQILYKLNLPLHLATTTTTTRLVLSLSLSLSLQQNAVVFFSISPPTHDMQMKPFSLLQKGHSLVDLN